MPSRIPADSTIRSIWPKLTNQRDYVAGARHKANLCQKQHGNASIKIGITGSGQKPCYRVWYKNKNGSEAIFGSYWDMHEPLDNERALNTNWSSASMTFDDLHAFMLEKHPLKSKIAM